MTLDAGTVVAIVMAVLAVLGGAAGGGIVWGRKTSLNEALKAEVERLTRRLDEALQKLEFVVRELGRDIDQADLHHRERSHELDRALQTLDRRMVRLEERLGIPSSPVFGDVTPPVQSVPRPATGPHRRSSSRDEQG